MTYDAICSALHKDGVGRRRLRGEKEAYVMLVLWSATLHIYLFFRLLLLFKAMEKEEKKAAFSTNDDNGSSNDEPTQIVFA